MKERTQRAMQATSASSPFPLRPGIPFDARDSRLITAYVTLETPMWRLRQLASRTQTKRSVQFDTLDSRTVAEVTS